ncbi:MAG: hypothetical protein WA118_05745 [Carboxydocellales bacterium]
MDWLILTITILCTGVILYFYYQNQQISQAEQSKTIRVEQTTNQLELERLKKERQEKQILEKQRAAEEESMLRLGQAIEPVLASFLAEHEWKNWFSHLQDAETLLKGQIITVQELLQHNISRSFPDGTSYRVGLIKQMPESEFSLSPEKVEALQDYFVSFLELSSQLKSKGIFVDKLQLHKALEEEIMKKYQLTV